MAHRSTRIALPLALLLAAPALAAEGHWQYGKGHGGPAHWKELSPEFATCGVGKHQSPIDIRNAKPEKLPELQFGYQVAAPKVVNNGHTIQVSVPPGSLLMVGDHTYELQQFHFHTPSEEAVQGKHAALVAHFVHKDAEGKLAVVAVLFDVGAESAALAPVFAKLPGEKGTDVFLEGSPLDPSSVLPAKRGYWEFEGSLTTPPCTEGVRWLVLREHAKISKAQLAAFKKLYPENARPLQPLNGRTIRASM